MEKVVSTKEKEIQAIKEDFKAHGISSEIPDKISAWGKLRRLKEGFYLNVTNLEDEVISGFEYHWSDGYLCLLRDLPRGQENKIVVKMYGFKRLSFDNITGRLYFQADFGRIGKQVAWVNKHGEFKVESSVGKAQG